MIRKKVFGIPEFDGGIEDANEQELERLAGEDGRLFDKHNGDKDGKAEQSLSPSFVSEDKELSKEETKGESTEGESASPRESGPLPAVIYSEQRANDETDRAERDSTERERERPCPRVKKRRRQGGVYVAVIVICLLLSLALLAMSYNSSEEVASVESLSEMTATDSETEESVLYNSAEKIYSLQKSSSVTVCIYLEDSVEYLSGTVLMDGGYVVTVCDGIYEAERVEIVSSDGKSRSAELLGYDAVADIALLGCDGEGLVPVESTDGYTFQAGDRLYAIGTAEDARFGGSLFEGVVSFEERTVEVFGQSGTRRAITVGVGGFFCDTLRGCPVYDEQGRAVAMMWGGTSGSVGLIVPMSRVLAVAECFRDGEAPDKSTLACIAYGTPVLGVIGENYSDGETVGVLIKDFTSELCDAALKLRRDDVLLRIDGRSVQSTYDVKQTVYGYRAGDTVEIHVLRDSQILSFFVELDG